MNIFNLVLISLIFTSLIVILVIFGRSLKRVKDINVISADNRSQARRANFVFRFFGWIIGLTKKSLVLTAEWFVKKIKKVLHLVHFWLIKIRKGKKTNGLADDIEAKKELIIEEEKNLDLVINDELAESDGEGPESDTIQKIELKQEREVLIRAEKSLGEMKETLENDNSRAKEKSNKIIKFFSRKSSDETEKTGKLVDSGSEENLVIEQERSEQISLAVGGQEAIRNEGLGEKGELKDEKSGLLGKIRAAFSFKNNVKGDQSEMEQDFSGFSDGVVKIGLPEKKPKEEQLIKEIIRTGSVKNGFDQDDELGIDRGILERKILKKVERDPRNMENYRQLGDLYIKMKNFEDAKNAYKFILKISPRDVDAKRKIEKIKLLKRLH